MAAARRYAATLEPYASGAYLNTLSDEGEPPCTGCTPTRSWPA